MEQPGPTPDTKHITPDKESLQPRFGKVVFGHWAHDFDFDQASTAFLLSKAKVFDAKKDRLTDVPLLAPGSAIEFKPVPDQKDLDDESVVVIEGIPRSEMKKNTKTSGNFDNFVRDKKEYPAAEAFAQAFNREIAGPDAAKISEFRTWLRAHEAKQPAPNLKLLNVHNLNRIADAFDAVKLAIYRGREHNPFYKQELVTNAVGLFEKAFSAGTMLLAEHDPAASAMYDKAVAELEAEERKNQGKLEARTQEKDALQFATILSQDASSAEISNREAAIFDVRGLGVEKGGIAKMLEKAKAQKKNPELVMLVDDELDDESNVVGTKMILRQIDEAVSSIDLDDIAARLHKYEGLFGKGYQFISKSDYGGHTFLLSTPRGGSALDHDKLWQGMQDYLSHKRYSESQWRQAVQTYAAKIGCTTFDPDLQLSATEGQFPQRQAVFRLGNKEIVLTERELPYYDSVSAPVSAGIDKNKQIILAKTPTAESADITRLKEQRAQELLSRSVTERLGIGILNALNNITAENVERLPLAQRMEIIRTISADPSAIRAVWDKDDARFGILDSDLREWMTPGSEAYKKATFDFSTSVSKKVDRHLIDSIHEQLMTEANPQMLSDFGSYITSILTSEEYRQSHVEVSYDRLLQSALRIVAEDKIPTDLRNSLVATIKASYADNKLHWHQAASADPLLLNKASEKSIELRSVFEALEVEPAVRTASTMPEAKIVDVDPDKVLAHRERQQAKEPNSPPYLTVFVEIGRPIRDLVNRKGILKLEKNEQGKYIKEEDVEFDGEISRAGSLIQSERDGPESSYLSDEVIKMVRQLHEQAPDSKIRIVRGGFSNFLSSRLTERLILKGGFSADILSKIVYCDWDMQKKQYYDYPMLSQ